MFAAIGAAVCLLCAGAHGQQLDTLEDPDAEAPPRFSVEFILFRYSDSVASGSELFLPDAPLDAEPAIPTYGDIPSAALGAEGEPRTFGDARPVDIDPNVVHTEASPDSAVVTLAAEEMLDEELLDEELTELPSARDIELRVLTEDERTMEEQYATLSRLGAYEPVLWSGWTQTVREEAQTPAVSLRRLGPIPLAFKGDLKLYLGRFLHLVVDLSLTYRQPVAEPAAPAEEPTMFGSIRSRDLGMQQISFRISEDRIVRNGDQRYFDHPKFGLLTKLTRVEDPPPETDESVLLPGS